MIALAYPQSNTKTRRNLDPRSTTDAYARIWTRHNASTRRAQPLTEQSLATIADRNHGEDQQSDTAEPLRPINPVSMISDALERATVTTQIAAIETLMGLYSSASIRDPYRAVNYETLYSAAFSFNDLTSDAIIDSLISSLEVMQSALDGLHRMILATSGIAVQPVWGAGNTSSTEVGVAMLERQAYNAMAELTESLNSFSRLEPDWDSYGALPPTTQALEAAHQLLRAIVPTVGEKALGGWIGPLPNGGFMFEWHGLLANIEVEVTPDGDFDLLIEERVDSDFEYTSTDDVDIDEIARQLNNVLSG